MSAEITEKSKHEFCKKAIALKEQIETEFIALGAMLCQTFDERLWEAGWSSWDEYAMEFKMSQSKLSKIMNIYRIFNLRFRIPQKKLAIAGGWSVVAEYLPLVKEETERSEVLDWIENATVMPRQHVRQTVKEKKTGIDLAKHKHGEEFYVLKIWSCCGEREVIEDTRKKN